MSIYSIRYEVSIEELHRYLVKGKGEINQIIERLKKQHNIKEEIYIKLINSNKKISAIFIDGNKISEKEVLNKYIIDFK